MFSYDVKFLTSDELLHLKNGDFKSYKYETKKKAEESVYDTAKRSYCESRRSHWRAPRPRQIRQLESKLRDRTIIVCEWTNDSLVTIVFSSGAIAYLTVKPNTLDVTQILFDRYCVGKLSGQNVTGVVLCKTHLLFTHADRMATLVTFGKVTSSLPCRITDRDPHLQSIELSGATRRAERKVSWCENTSGVRVLVWSAASTEPAPWSPVLEDHANLHLYQITGQQVNLVACHHLENETLSAELSHKCDNIVHIVEQVTCHKSGVSITWLRYEVSSEERASRLSCRETATHARMPAPARAVRRSPCDARLLVACIDGSLHLVHHAAGLTHSTTAGFIASEVVWAGEVVVAAEEGGRLQCFDRALAALHHHTKCIDLASYMRDTRRVQLLATRNLRGGPLILATFTGGPLTLLRINHPRLLTSWIRTGRTSHAVSLLRALDWESEGAQCLCAVGRLVCAALGGGAGEAAAQAALGTYLAPAAPHGPAAQRYAPAVHDLARKFFHHLLRRGRVEKALSLAVDLAAWDLFVDARWAAARRGLSHLADEAAGLANHYAQLHPTVSECSETCSQCSSHSYCSEDETSAPETVRTKPPPLPRVSLPAQPTHRPTTILTQPTLRATSIPTQPTHSSQPISTQPTLVPVTRIQTEPLSTNSIRPNLHQYLERDNTIWNTDVRDDTYMRKEPFKPALSLQSSKWHSVDNVLSNYKHNSKHGSLVTINEVHSKPTSHTVIDVIPRPYDERTATAQFRHLFQTELREEAPNTLYRYQNNSYHPSTTTGDRAFKHDNSTSERTANRPHGEKNKVKFSDTVTIAVVSQEPVRCPEPARELADSLPLCAPHNYLAAFAPHPPHPPAGTTLDYVEV